MTGARRITDTAPRRVNRVRRLRGRMPAIDDREALFLSGLVGVGFGFALIWLPLGVIIPSVVLVVIAILAPPNSRKDDE